jgi:hypothetical protein
VIGFNKGLRFEPDERHAGGFQAFYFVHVFLRDLYLLAAERVVGAHDSIKQHLTLCI